MLNNIFIIGKNYYPMIYPNSYLKYTLHRTITLSADDFGCKTYP